VSEIVLPLTFAAVLAVIFTPLARTLQRHRWKPSLAAGAVALCLLAVIGGVVVATLRGVTEQADQISAVTAKALNNAADQLNAAGAGKAALDDARAATEDAAPMIANGFLTKVISGGSLIGLVSGIILGALIMYYLLKDGTSLRRSLVAGSATPRCAATSTASSVIPAGSCATTGGAAPSCPPSWRWSSASPPSCSACRSCSPSSWSTSSAATSPTSAPFSAEGWP
jgi:AI-2E family transporter